MGASLCPWATSLARPPDCWYLCRRLTVPPPWSRRAQLLSGARQSPFKSCCSFFGSGPVAGSPAAPAPRGAPTSLPLLGQGSCATSGPMRTWPGPACPGELGLQPGRARQPGFWSSGCGASAVASPAPDPDPGPRKTHPRCLCGLWTFTPRKLTPVGGSLAPCPALVWSLVPCA